MCDATRRGRSPKHKKARDSAESTVRAFVSRAAGARTTRVTSHCLTSVVQVVPLQNHSRVGKEQGSRQYRLAMQCWFRAADNCWARSIRLRRTTQTLAHRFGSRRGATFAQKPCEVEAKEFEVLRLRRVGTAVLRRRVAFRPAISAANVSLLIVYVPRQTNSPEGIR